MVSDPDGNTVEFLQPASASQTARQLLIEEQPHGRSVTSESFKRGHNLLTRHAWKLVEGVSFFDVIDQVAQRHPGSYEDRQPARICG